MADFKMEIFFTNSNKTNRYGSINRKQNDKI